MSNTKLVVITGATSGIGLACSKSLAKKGYDLILIARNYSNLKKLKNNLYQKYKASSIIISCDIANYDDYHNKLSEINIKNVHILINNAGVSHESENIAKTNIEDIHKMIHTNIIGAINSTKLIIPFMMKSGKGDILNISSIAGSYPFPNESIYSSTKSFLNMFSKSLNIDFSSSGIRICNISPGIVKTNFPAIRHEGSKLKISTAYSGYTPLSPKDISNLVEYIIETPEHVNISDVVIMPSDKRNIFNM